MDLTTTMRKLVRKVPDWFDVRRYNQRAKLLTVSQWAYELEMRLAIYRATQDAYQSGGKSERNLAKAQATVYLKWMQDHPLEQGVPGSEGSQRRAPVVRLLSVWDLLELS